EYFDFTKIENKIQVDLRKKSLRTSPQQTITFRNILINEEDAGVLSEINLFGDETFEMVNELRYDLVKKRILFPYSINGALQLGDGYTRLTAEGNIRLNYPKSKNGIDVRIFAGKFFGESTGYYRNTFTMQGADGYEDFLYDEIFFGRNVYGGLWDNQIMMRDGFMKIKNYSGSASLNYSDDLMAAANFEFAIPKLSFIALFADLVYNSTSDDIYPENGNIFYDGGVMLRLPNNIFEIYFPLIQSDVFDVITLDELPYKEKITFMLDVNALNVFELLRKL
ncbi:MAG: hypothetical protein H7Y00_08785, partial [Fimbriimonadaceae bacterium]|nr:hypothetical protein [Chitinophagales bacterium]